MRVSSVALTGGGWPPGRWAALTVIGFVLSPTTGLPASTGDIGSCPESLGVASLFVEAGVSLLSGDALALARREHRPGVHAALALGDH